MNTASDLSIMSMTQDCEAKVFFLDLAVAEAIERIDAPNRLRRVSLRHVVLQRKDVLDGTFKTIRPKVCPGCGIDKLPAMRTRLADFRTQPSRR